MNSLIETLNQWGGNFSGFAWPMLWQSSLLIAALFAFDFLFRRKIRASVRYALWLVVLVKLCLPVTFALPTSPAWWLHKIPPPAVVKSETHFTVTYDDAPLPQIPQIPPQVFAPPKPAMTLAAWLLMISASVSVALLVWLLARWWQIAQKVRCAADSPRLTAIAGEAQKILGRKSKVQVRLAANPMSPAVCGLFRPAILIPQPLVENFPDGQLRAVLLHELIHLRRRDVWMNFLQALLQIFYWWHPLVWLANARIRRVREEAVDDAVMLALRDDAESYAPTLLEVAKLALNRPLAGLGLVGIMESRHALRQRIERLLDFRPPRKAGLTLVSLLGILAFSAVAVPMGEGPAQTNNPASPVVSDNLNQTNPSVSAVVNVSSSTNDFDEKTKFAQMVQDAKLDYEMGKLDEAEAKLKMILAQDSNNEAAYYYLDLVDKARLAPKNSPLMIHPIWDASPIPITMTFKINGPTDGDKLKTILQDAGVKMPPTVYYYMDNGIFLVRGSKEQVALVNRVMLKLNGFPQKDIEATDREFISQFRVAGSAESTATNLFERTFKVDPNRFFNALQNAALQTTNASMMAGIFFSKLGVDWESPAGKAVIYNDGLGLLFARATNPDLDTIERVIQALNQVPPQIHIKARFVEVPKNDSKSPNFGTYLGQFKDGKMLLWTNPLDVFPGITTSSTFGSPNSYPTNAPIMAVLTDADSRAAFHYLELRSGFENLAEPEVTTTSGRQTQMRATAIITVTVVTNFALEENVTNGRSSVVPQMSKVETGPILDVVPYVLSDGYTVSLALNPSLTEFLGYDKTTNTTAAYYRSGERVDVPKISPDFRVRQAAATVNLWDNQTVVIGGLPEKDYVNGKEVFDQSKSSDKELLVFVTATIVDASGNRVHSDDEMPFAKNGIPAQPKH